LELSNHKLRNIDQSSGLCNGTQMQFIEKLITDEDGEDIKVTSNAGYREIF
jgi:hypothetical protein